MLRAALADGSPLGEKARVFIESGRLVPDVLIGDLIVERLSKPDTADGFILDGFPRTVEQVALLDQAMEQAARSLDTVIALVVGDREEIVRRLSGRRTCPQCRSVFHIVNQPPQEEGVCDKCQMTLEQRRDDKEEVIRERLKVYDDQTAPVLALYDERELLNRVNGLGTPDEVFRSVREALDVAV
jgi:adenylate kinase